MSISVLRAFRRAAIAAICCIACGSMDLVAASEWTGAVISLEPHAGKRHEPVITALAIHPGGQFLALGGDDHLVRIWDVREKKQARVLEGHTDWVRTVSYSPSGELLVTSGNDHRVVVWSSETGEKLREYSQLSHVVTRVVFSHDGRLVAVVGFGDTLRIIDGMTGDRLREYRCPCDDMRTVAFSPDDQVIVGGGRNGKIRLWNGTSGETLAEFSAHSQRIRDLAFSADGALLATCGEDRKVVISRSNGEQAFELPRQGAKVMTLVFCGAEQLATAGSDNVVRIWDLNTRAEVAALSGHTGTVAVLAYRDGMLVSTGFDTTVRTWTRRSHLTGGETSDAPQRVGVRPRELESR